MNKIYKYLLIGLAIFSVFFACFSSAFDLTFSSNGSYPTSVNTDIGSSGQIVCASTQSNYNGLNLGGVSIPRYQIACAKGPVNINGSQVYYTIYDIDCGTCPSCPSCPSQYTSLECQSEYNLIPLENVTANYCKLNYDLIEPTECPMNEGTGNISRTPRYINNEQYPGTALLRITIPDYIGFSTTYNTEETYLEIEGYNADEDYINKVIDQEKLTPTNEDFANLINGIIAFIPYLFISLLFFRLVKIINKIWK